MMLNETMTEVFVDPVEEILKDSPYAIILYNDNVNTFDTVRDALVKYCEHTELQANQCATIVHYKGKCDVKHGYYEALKPICSALLDYGLKARIE